MQRGDRVVLIAVIGIILITAIVSIVVYTGTTGGVILSRRSYNPESLSIVCNRVMCDSGPPIYLGMSGTYVTCCCPENYKGGRMGDCTRPLQLMI